MKLVGTVGLDDIKLYEIFDTSRDTRVFFRPEMKFAKRLKMVFFAIPYDSIRLKYFVRTQICFRDCSKSHYDIMSSYMRKQNLQYDVVLSVHKYQSLSKLGKKWKICKYL